MNTQITIDGQMGHIVPAGAGVGVVRMNGDETLNVHFYNKPVIDPIESKNRGRPWNKNVEYVRIQIAGEKDYVDRPATEMDHGRFPRQYQAFATGQKPIPQGTPVDILFPQSPEIGLNLHGLGVHTVEQLAGLTEHGAQTIGMGATMWRNKAKEFLSAAAGGVGVHKLERALEERDSKIEVLQNQLAAQKAQIDQLMALMEQKIPPAMVPAHRPTQAQAFANDYIEPEASSYQGDSFSPPEANSGWPEPLFVEEPEIASEPLADVPLKRGPGRPRKNPTERI